ncbi:hypothetical protein [Mucilaginibacter pedocola]|nr:hypothetical protein [Mucilaginibacter pedocola]
MNSIQRLVKHQFTDKTVITGNKIIEIAAVITALGSAVFPFLLLLIRLS